MKICRLRQAPKEMGRSMLIDYALSDLPTRQNRRSGWSNSPNGVGRELNGLLLVILDPLCEPASSLLLFLLLSSSFVCLQTPLSEDLSKRLSYTDGGGSGSVS